MFMKDVQITLASDEALVLFNLLSRFEDKDKMKFIDQSEKIVLWLLLGKLEKILVEPFKSNYLDLLSDSRERLKTQYGD
jgi:hypothetical protein